MMLATVLLKGFSLVIGAIVLIRVLLLKLRKRPHSKEAYDRFQDQVVLVTGASSGLGEELAKTFYQHGAKVILASRRREELERVKGDLQTLQPPPNSGSSGVRFHEPKIAILDLGTEDNDQLEKTAEEIVRLHGHIDILVNNAGISSRAAALTTAMAVDRQLILVNYLNQIALTKVALRTMVLKQDSSSISERGHIVCVSSVQGRMAIPGRSSYSASKHAVQAYYDSLRAELSALSAEDAASRRPVDVTVISPGYIRTNLSLNAMTGDGRRHARMDATTAAGLEPSVVAERVLEAVLNREADLVLSPLLPKLLIIVRALCPPLYFLAMKVYAKKQH